MPRPLGFVHDDDFMYQVTGAGAESWLNGRDEVEAAHLRICAVWQQEYERLRALDVPFPPPLADGPSVHALEKGETDGAMWLRPWSGSVVMIPLYPHGAVRWVCAITYMRTTTDRFLACPECAARIVTVDWPTSPAEFDTWSCRGRVDPAPPEKRPGPFFGVRLDFTGDDRATLPTWFDVDAAERRASLGKAMPDLGAPA